MVQIELTFECAICAAQFGFGDLFAHITIHPNATLADISVIADDENIQAIFLVHLRSELRKYINNLAVHGVMVDVLMTGKHTIMNQPENFLIKL